MKFLCEHCKAKYQIADEKVAGRTVRMKCRKCGNQIEVRAAVTETSVSTHLPKDPNAPAGAGPAAPSEAPSGPRAGLRPSPAKPAAPRSGLATSLSAAKPTAPRAAPAPRAAERAPEGGALAGAFQRSVQKEEEISVALDLRELSAADEWYVAINGVPVGPVRVAELRRKAALGVVNEDSLVWQEGMEEWRPVRAVTELAAVVREAAAGGRVSLLTPPPPEGRPSSYPGPASTRPPPASTRPGAPAGMSPRPQTPQKPSSLPAHATARSNVVPITSRLATAERLDEDATVIEPQPPAPMLAPDPFAGTSASAPPAASISAQLNALTATPAPGVAAAAALAAPAGPPLGAPVGGPLYQAPFALPELQKKAPPFILIAMFVLAGAFGVTAAILVFKQAPPIPQVVLTVPSGAIPPATPTAAPTPTTPDVAPTDSAAAATSGTPSSPRVASRGGSGSRGGSSPTAATDPDLQSLIKGQTGGPSSGGPGGSSGGGGGNATLSEAQVRNVVMSHSAGIKRTCWERTTSQVTSANIDVRISVAANGSVTSADATGNDPVIAKCIENSVRGWVFPPSDGPSTITVPFHFLRQ